MNTLEVLTKARELIATPDRWTQGKMARDALGIDTDEFSDDAACFCAEGALRRAGGDTWRDAFNAVTLQVESIRPLHYFNDHATHADVLALFDRAIAKEAANG